MNNFIFAGSPKHHKASHQFGGTDVINIYGLPGQHAVPLINAAADIIPIATDWLTAPNNLENTTDDDFDTVSGTGITDSIISNLPGVLSFTLPEAGIFILYAKLGVWNPSDNVIIDIFTKTDLINYDANPIIQQVIGSATEKIVHITGLLTITNALKLRFGDNGIANSSAKIYEVKLIQIA